MELADLPCQSEDNKRRVEFSKQVARSALDPLTGIHPPPK